MRTNWARKAAAVILTGASLGLSGCGSSSNETVDKSEITNMSAIGAVEGTTNDMSAMETPADTNVAAMPAPADNASDNSSATENAM